MRCAFCHQTIELETAWKGSADSFYCSEFCSDSETIVPAQPLVAKDKIDRHYVDRLERLLPLRRAISTGMTPKSAA